MQSSPGSQPTSCRRVFAYQHVSSGLLVQMDQDLISLGTRALLVVDCLDSIDLVLAAKHALEQIGGDAIGISCVVATNAHVLSELKAFQIPFHCAWSPSSGAQLTMPTKEVDGQCTCVCAQKRPRPVSEQASNRFILDHYTAHYDANAPGEDRYVNAVSLTDAGEDWSRLLHMDIDVAKCEYRYSDICGV